MLIDEVEHGLDPHRIRRLLRNLKDSVHSRDEDESSAVAARPGQVLVTTHSPVAVRELSPEELRVTRSHKGVTEIIPPESDLKTAIVQDPEAILGRKVVVCEGKTEVGFYRGVGEAWAERNNGIPLACHGVVPIHGEGGKQGPGVARKLKKVCDRVMYFGDSDEPPKPSKTTLAEAGVDVVLWPNGLSTEECVAQGLPWPGLVNLVKHAISETCKRYVIDMINKELPEDCAELGDDLDAWRNAGVDLHIVGRAVGTAAKEHKWFKSYEGGQRLGEIVGETLANLGESDLLTTIEKLEKWAYAE